MAGEWMKIEQVLPDKPEVLQLSRLLELSRDDVVGKLFRFWSWWSSHCTENALPASIVSIIDDVIGMNGFAEALKAVGWLSDDESKAWLPNFDRHVSRTAKKRAIENERKRRWRAGQLDADPVQKPADDENTDVATDGGMDGDTEVIGSHDETHGQGTHGGGQIAERSTTQKERSQDAPKHGAKGRRGARTKFRAPGVTECREWCQLHGFPAAIGQEFHDHYRANGWHMGNGNKMASWHAALNLFAKNAKEQHRQHSMNNNGRPPNGHALMDAQREAPRDLAERIAANGL